MPNTKSAEKRVRQTETRTLRNRVVKSRMKTFRSKVHESVESGDQKEIEASFRAFASAVDKAAKSGVIHKNTAARYKSAMTKLIAKK